MILVVLKVQEGVAGGLSNGYGWGSHPVEPLSIPVPNVGKAASMSSAAAGALAFPKLIRAALKPALGGYGATAAMEAVDHAVTACTCIHTYTRTYPTCICTSASLAR